GRGLSGQRDAENQRETDEHSARSTRAAAPALGYSSRRGPEATLRRARLEAPRRLRPDPRKSRVGRGPDSLRIAEKTERIRRSILAAPTDAALPSLARAERA